MSTYLTVKAILSFALLTFGFTTEQNNDFYSSGSEEGWTRELSVGDDYSVKSVPAPTRSGDAALRMETRYGDSSSGYHAEMEKFEAGGPGERVWYGFSTYVPTSWVDSEQTAIVAQWWSHSPASPPLGIEIEGENWFVFQRWAEGEAGKARRAVGSVRKGEWTDWVVEAHWSHSDDGYLKVWQGGEVVYERSGPSIYRKTESLRFKVGVYVWPWKSSRPSPSSSSPRVIYHDEIRIGREGASYDTVSPR